MMDDGALKVPKKQVPVTLWVHPEGRVVGSMFVHFPGSDSSDGEQPWDVINEAGDFVAIKLDEPEEMRFYNKSSVVRVEYRDGATLLLAEGRPLPCMITMMDGSLIEGDICKATPVERSRLYDYMNDTSERFLNLRSHDVEVMLVNKSYVVYIGAVDARSRNVAESGGMVAAREPLALVA
jgi:hypothetical protein